jgi:hypothetical protein
MQFLELAPPKLANKLLVTAKLPAYFPREKSDLYFEIQALDDQGRYTYRLPKKSFWSKRFFNNKIDPKVQALYFAYTLIAQADNQIEASITLKPKNLNPEVYQWLSVYLSLYQKIYGQGPQIIGQANLNTPEMQKLLAEGTTLLLKERMLPQWTEMPKTPVSSPKPKLIHALKI